MDKRTLFRRYTIFCIVVFTLIVVAVFVRQGLITNGARDLVEHGYDERDQIQRVFSRIKDIEIGQRGFALSGDSSYLAPYIAALYGKTSALSVDPEVTFAVSDLTLWDELRRLREHFPDKPEQLEAAQVLEGLARRRVEYAEEVIYARATGGAEAAIEIIKTGRGKHIMDSTRAVVGA